ncbi:unnamed protein product, partial [marine sediment metagenome]
VVIVGGLGLGLAGVVVMAALARAAPPDEFEVSDLIISPYEVQIGYPVSISCLVENIGTEIGSKTIICEVDGAIVAEQIVTLAPGESEVVTFEVTPEVAKTYSVSVDGLYGSFEATEMPVADIRVENLVISPTEPMVGEIVTISVTVTNIEGEAGSHTVYLAGDFRAEQTVTLTPGESKVVSFEVTPDIAKAYSVSVDGLHGSFVATEIGVPAYSVALGVLNMTPKVDEYVEWWVDITNIGTAPGAPTIKWYRDGSYSYSSVSPSIEPG